MGNIGRNMQARTVPSFISESNFDGTQNISEMML
jgi:hypothetical protein